MVFFYIHTSGNGGGWLGVFSLGAEGGGYTAEGIWFAAQGRIAHQNSKKANFN